jgi:hypothetical protein
MTSPAGFFIPIQHKVVTVRPRVWSFPQHSRRFGIPVDLNAFKVAGLAGDTQVGVMGDLFIMPCMTEDASGPFLTSMPETGSLRVTGETA